MDIQDAAPTLAQWVAHRGAQTPDSEILGPMMRALMASMRLDAEPMLSFIDFSLIQASRNALNPSRFRFAS